MTEHEEAFVRNFIQKQKRARCLYLLSDPSRRFRFIRELSHFKWLEEGLAKEIASEVADTAEEICQLLREKGASDRVWLISEDPSLDGKELNLDIAMERVKWSGIGSIVLCVPGSLYFEGEVEARLLEK